MTQVTSDEIAHLMKDLAKSNGPKVIFPFGCKIVEFRGEKVLQPLTPDEYQKLPGVPAGQRALDEVCVFVASACYPQGCSGACLPNFEDGNFYCVCVYQGS